MRITGYIHAPAILTALLAGAAAQAQSSMEHDHGAHHHHHPAAAQPQSANPAPAAPTAAPHAGHHHADGHAEDHAGHHHAGSHPEDHAGHHAGHGAAEHATGHAGHGTQSHDHHSGHDAQDHSHHGGHDAGHPGAQDAPAQQTHMDHGSMQGGSAPADARDPHAYSGGLKRGEGIYAVPGAPRLMLADEHRFASFQVNKLERRFTHKGENDTAYGIRAWYGGTYNRLLLKAKGDIAGGKLEESRTELLWNRAISAYWDAQLGARLDTGEGPNRQWLALGIEGTAPYWLDIEATAYVGGSGRTALRLEASYELQLSQELVLEPKIEMQFFGKNDPAKQIGRGLSEASAGLRLYYEFTPRFAPYIGVERSASFGRTADYIRADGGRAQQTRFMAGLSFWF